MCKAKQYNVPEKKDVTNPGHLLFLYETVCPLCLSGGKKSNTKNANISKVYSLRKVVSGWSDRCVKGNSSQ